MRFLRPVLLAATVLAVALVACPPARSGSVAPVVTPFAESARIPIDAEAVLRHTRVLSSDAFEGRAPGTRGEERTVAYLAEQLRAAGLEPFGTGGSWFVSVPLVGFTSRPGPLVFARGAAREVLQPREDFVAWSSWSDAVMRLRDAEVVFAGYGVRAPEFGWDDYGSVDVAGKVVVVLAGDPPVRDPADASRLDPKVFGGSALTYHGRWTCKCEVAADRGAAGVLIVHDAAAAGYPFSVVQGRAAEHLGLVSAGGGRAPARVEGWIRGDRARALFALAGQDLDRLAGLAACRGFRAVPLGMRASVTVDNEVRSVVSRNVVGRLPGSDPARRDECVIYSAHWDHLGLGPPVDGDPVRHGAADNAVAVGGLIELARAFAAAPRRPGRSVLFLATTAEEQGMLGAEHYARHPLVPLEKTLAVLSFELPNVYGRTEDMSVRGGAASDLDDLLREVCAAQGRVVTPDPVPEQGWFYRSDHFPFARRGVPAMWAGAGDRYVGRPADYGARMRADYVAHRYHKPGDQVTADWDLRGAVEDFQAYHAVGLRVLEGGVRPRWRPGFEFERGTRSRGE